MIVDYIKTVCHKVQSVLYILLKVFANNVQDKLLILTEFVDWIKYSLYVNKLSKKENVKNVPNLALSLTEFVNINLRTVLNIMLIIHVMYVELLIDV